MTSINASELFYDVDAEEAAQILKATGNAHFTEKRYEEAIGIYTSLIDQYKGKAMLDTVRTVMCNRAACYLELENFVECIEDCRVVLKNRERVSSAVTRKAYVRLARGLKGLDQLDEALEALTQLRDMNTGYDPAEKKIRDEIIKEKDKREKEDRIQNIPIEEYENVRKKITGEGRLPHRPQSPNIFGGYQGEMTPFRYEVRIHGEPEPFVFTKTVPIGLCEPRADSTASEQFLGQLVYRHIDDLMNSRRWGCWYCHRYAATIVHTPMSYLQQRPPCVVDYVQPVCKIGGVCEKAARLMMEDLVREIAELTALSMAGYYRG